MKSLNSAVHTLPLLGFDTETTGVDVFNDRVVTCNITYLINGEKIVNDFVINPGIDIPEEASNVHGVTTEYATENGSSPQEMLQIIHDHLYAWESKGLPAVAFNATFDCSILTYEFERHGIENKLSWENVVDPFVLDKHYSPYRRGKRTLGRVSEIYGVELDNAHSADADVLAALEVLTAILEAHSNDMNVKSLHKMCKNEKYKQSESLEEYFRRKDPEAKVSRDYPVMSK